MTWNGAFFDFRALSAELNAVRDGDPHSASIVKSAVARHKAQEKLRVMARHHHVDLYLELMLRTKRSVSLDAASRAMGYAAKDIGGKNIQREWNAGNVKGVVDHNRDDVARTFAIHEAVLKHKKIRFAVKGRVHTAVVPRFTPDVRFLCETVVAELSKEMGGGGGGGGEDEENGREKTPLALRVASMRNTCDWLHGKKGSGKR